MPQQKFPTLVMRFSYLCEITYISSSTVKDKDFVFIGNQPWDIPIGSNCKNIAREVARHNRVLYVNKPLSYNTLWRHKKEDKEFINRRKDVLKGNAEPLKHIENGLYTFDPPVLLNSINWMPDGFIYDFLNKRNNCKLHNAIKEQAEHLDMQDFYLFNDSEMFLGFYAQQMLQPRKAIYYSRDNLTSTGYFKRHGVRTEPKIIADYDLATANSLYLKDYCARFNRNSFYVGQGCDLSIFNPEKKFTQPVDFKDIKRPIIGYIGALLQLRLDIPLLEKLAARRPKWSFVFIGPEDEHFKRSTLHQMNNMHFLGSKKPEELAEYLYPFDVAMNPQAVNPMTIGNYPRKIDEYLAMGKPTVTTSTRAMEIFKDHVYLATDLDSYEKKIERALREHTPQLERKRIAFAQSHSWENSVAEIYRAIEQVEDI